MMPYANSKPLISLIIPCYNESLVFPPLREELSSLADTLTADYRVELVFVDDGSRDSTWEHIEEFAQSDPRVRGIALSRNFGHQMALTCGYDMAQGDAIVCMDADLQDPPEVVLEMVRKWREGYDVVHAVRTEREGESRFKLWTAALFYRFLRLLGAVHVKADAGDFRLMSRRALHALGELREQHRFVRGMAGWIGFRSTEIFYRRKPRRAGETKYPLKKMLRFAVDAVVSFSSIPLRLSYIAALLLSLVICGYLASVTVNHFVFGSPLVPGWSSLIIAVASLGVMNLICLGLLGEYVGRIYEQVKRRPLYFIRETTTTDNSPDVSPEHHDAG